jgi:hypothetical protein
MKGALSLTFRKLSPTSIPPSVHVFLLFGSRKQRTRRFLPPRLGEKKTITPRQKQKGRETGKETEIIKQKEN